MSAMGWRRLWLSLPVAAALLVSGCVARHVRISELGLTCSDAQHVAIETVRRLGYTITEATQPSPGLPGVIVASRRDGTSKRGLMVSVFCTTQGAEVEAKTEQGGLTEVNFPAEFRRSFQSALTAQPPPRPPAESGVDVLVAPERGAAANLGVDLSQLGILPVNVRITNRTPRPYRFEAGGVALQTAAGDRAHALGVAQLAKQLDATAMQTLRPKLLADHNIAPNETVSGVLLFPFNAYVRARVQLIDRATDETEGFSIEF